MKAIFGYRTVLSTRNPETWREANLFAARFSIRIGIVLVPLGILMGILFRKPGQGFYMFTVGSVAIAALMLLGNTEWYLAQTFDDEGLRKYPSR
ncbi:MAG TPA: SdpI family protein [Chitinophagaceae bacterium]|nr:SdpI family protein [Chitinophagaceae bacterium]